jgi:hypothetical protein
LYWSIAPKTKIAAKGMFSIYQNRRMDFVFDAAENENLRQSCASQSFNLMEVTEVPTCRENPPEDDFDFTNPAGCGNHRAPISTHAC